MFYAEVIEDVEMKRTDGLDVVLTFRSTYISEAVVMEKNHRLKRWFERITRE